VIMSVIIAINQLYFIKHSRHAKTAFWIKSRNYRIQIVEMMSPSSAPSNNHKVSSTCRIFSPITISLFTCVCLIIILIHQRCILITADSVWLCRACVHASSLEWPVRDEVPQMVEETRRVSLTNEPSSSLLGMKCQCGKRWILIPALNKQFRI